MESATERVCPDCRVPSHEIRLLAGPFLNKPFHDTTSGITYTLPGAKPSLWTSTIPLEGRVAAYLCDGCGRIALYAVPNDES